MFLMQYLLLQYLLGHYCIRQGAVQIEVLSDEWKRNCKMKVMNFSWFLEN